MKEKWLQLEIFPKSILVSLIFTSLMIVIGSILLVVDTSYLYGALIGAGLLYISYLIIWILWYRIPKIKKTMAKTTPFLAPLIRIVIFLTVLLIIAFTYDNGTGLEGFLHPINTLIMLFTYTFTLFSYGLVIVIDKILRKEIKEENQEEV